MRACSQCGCDDRELPGTEGDGQHWVVPELRWLHGPLTRELERRGWRERVWQGRRAMMRMVCRGCLDRLASDGRVWDEMRREARAKEGQGDDRFWRDLCEA